MRTLIKKLFSVLGLHRHIIKNFNIKAITVLCYHGIKDEKWSRGEMTLEEQHILASDFEKHCRFYSEYCNPISINHFVKGLKTKDPLPNRPVLLTFDDGLETWYTHARPILRKYNIPALFSVTTDPIEKGQLFWFDALSREKELESIYYIRNLPYEEWKRKINNLSLDVDEQDPNKPLTIEQVKALSTEPGFEIGAHTLSHPTLSTASLDEQSEEINRSKEKIEAWIGKPVRAFVYPFGTAGKDYTADTVRLVQEAGIDLAFSVSVRDLATSDTSPLEIPRIEIKADKSVDQIMCDMCTMYIKNKYRIVIRYIKALRKMLNFRLYLKK